MLIVDIKLETGPGFETVRAMNSSYQPMNADDFKDRPARLTERQASFLRNVISVAQFLQSSEIPVAFQLTDGGCVFWDRGCIKIAELAGFIKPLKNGPSGFVEFFDLNFSVLAK